MILRNSKRYMSLTHVTNGLPNMVDVSSKNQSLRIATAQAVVHLPKDIYNSIIKNESNSTIEINSKKGPVISTAIIAGVMACKKTSDVIPFCHPISITGCDITIKQIDNESSLLINCTVKTIGQTGVEMEALVGATTSSLCIYDMLKALSHDIVIKEIKLLTKSGGKSDYKNSN